MKGPVSKVSMLLSDFQRMYSQFCTREGYTEMNIEDEGLETFTLFNIKLENQQG